MTALFEKFMSAGISSAAVLLCVLLIRAVLNKTNKTPHWIVCFLWAFAGLKLLIPFSPKAAFGLLFLPSSEASAPPVSPAVPGGTAGAPLPAAVQNVGADIGWQSIAAIIWAAGIAAMIIYFAVSSLMLRRKLSTAVPCENISSPVPVKMSEHIRSPFIFGVIRPVIYLPFRLNADTVKCVISHETAHIKRHDNLWKPAAFFILALHWYDPLAWLCFSLFCRDTELACDERAYRNLSETERCAYAEALVRCAAPSKIISICPVSFGESGIKSRVKHALQYKKPAFAFTACALILSVIVCVCFATQNSSAQVASQKNLSTPLPTAAEQKNTVEVKENKEEIKEKSSTEKEVPDKEKTDNTASNDLPKATGNVTEPEETAEAVLSAEAASQKGGNEASLEKVKPSEASPETEKADKNAASAPTVKKESGKNAGSNSQAAEKSSAPSETESTSETANKEETASYETDPPSSNDCSVIGHDYTEGVAIPWNCTENGVKSYTCTRCGDYFEKFVRAVGHDYYSRHIPATCTQGGAYIYTCNICKNEETVPVSIEPPLGHSFVDGICTRCNKEN